MSAQESVRNPDFIQMASMFGRSRAQLMRMFRRLDQSRIEFVKAQGDRASLDDIASVLPRLIERLERLEGEKVTRQVVHSASRIATDARDSILNTRISADVAIEADDGCEEAAKLLAALHGLAKANDAMTASCEALDDEFDEDLGTGEESMPNNDGDKAPGNRAGGTMRKGRGALLQVTTNSVTSQLIATLDRLGLPHSNGTLDVEDDTEGRLTEQLIRALTDRFESYETNTGLSVRSRKRPLGGFRNASAELSGRLAVDAQAIAFAGDQLAATLDGIDNQVRFVERPGTSGGAPRMRAMVTRRIEEIQSLSSSPQGIPVSQANVKAVQLMRETIEYLAAIGIQIKTNAEEWRENEPEPFNHEAVILPEGRVVREELRAEVVEVSRLLQGIRIRLLKAARHRSDAELGYRLERTLERAVTTARTTLDMLGSVDMADTLNLWESMDIEVPDGCAALESLGNGLTDALGWLIDVGQPFAESDREVEKLGSLAMAGLAAELKQIGMILEACAKPLGEMELEGTAFDIATNSHGLAVISSKCAEYARRLA